MIVPYRPLLNGKHIDFLVWCVDERSDRSCSHSGQLNSQHCCFPLRSSAGQWL
jgi:hypothetical protein